MRVGVVSDLHFEFHADHGASLIAGLDKSVDVLVAAGDIGVGEGIVDALDRLCAVFEHVVFVNGNHELYGTTYEQAAAFFAEAAGAHPNLSWVRPGHPAEVRRQRFVGGTLWFRRHPERLKQYLNDFHYISNLEDWVYAVNLQTVQYLEHEVLPTDIVVTHHLPSFKSVAPRYVGSPLNAFFVCDVEPLIVRAQPKLWLHGHTHDACDYRIGATRVVCNPFGYPKEVDLSYNVKILEVT